MVPNVGKKHTREDGGAVTPVHVGTSGHSGSLVPIQLAVQRAGAGERLRLCACPFLFISMIFH